MAVQKLNVIDRMNQRQNKCFYTSYSEMNEMLTRFAAEADGIWMSAEVQELKKNRSNDQLCRIVSMALDTAKSNCIETTPPTEPLHQNPLPGHTGADTDQNSVFLRGRHDSRIRQGNH